MVRTYIRKTEQIENVVEWVGQEQRWLDGGYFKFCQEGKVVALDETQQCNVSVHSKQGRERRGRLTPRLRAGGPGSGH